MICCGSEICVCISLKKNIMSLNIMVDTFSQGVHSFNTLLLPFSLFWNRDFLKEKIMKTSSDFVR